MSNLKKGDLVMTNFDKLLWYDHTTSCDVHYGRAFDNKLISFKECHKATRYEVEAYLKEKGWAEDGADYIIRKENFIWCSLVKHKGIWNVTATFTPNNFDTAPEQLAEAILMARLLNATKD